MKNRKTLLLAIVLGWMIVASPTVWAQSLFSQNKPEQVEALREDTQRANAAAIVQRDAAIAQRDAAIAAGNTAAAEQLTKAVAFWEKAVAASGVAATIAGASANGDTAGEDAGWVTLGGLLPPPFNVVAMIGLPVLFREWRAWQQRKAAAEALAKAKQEAAENEAAAKSIVNSIDQIRIAKPEVAAAMKELTANTATDFTANLTPKAKEIIDAERLT